MKARSWMRSPRKQMLKGGLELEVDKPPSASKPALFGLCSVFKIFEQVAVACLWFFGCLEYIFLFWWQHPNFPLRNFISSDLRPCALDQVPPLTPNQVCDPGLANPSRVAWPHGWSKNGLVIQVGPIRAELGDSGGAPRRELFLFSA